MADRANCQNANIAFFNEIIFFLPATCFQLLSFIGQHEAFKEKAEWHWMPLRFSKKLYSFFIYRRDGHMSRSAL